MIIHYATGMPRAGTTLLQNILSQNPRFYGSSTSGLLELLYAARAQFSTLAEFKAQDQPAMERAFRSFCLQACQGWYAGLTDRPVCFDKSRGWLHYFEFLSSFQPEAKIILVIRDIRACLSSLEKKFRANALRHDANDKPHELRFVTVEDRVNTWLQSPPLGLAIKRIQGAIQRGLLNGRRVCVVRFENLTAEPERTLRAVYEYLGEEWYPHDFAHVAQVTRENDAEYGGIYGDHAIRQAVLSVEPDWEALLGRNLARSIVQSHRWFYEAFYPGVK